MLRRDQAKAAKQGVQPNGSNGLLTQPLSRSSVMGTKFMAIASLTKILHSLVPPKGSRSRRFIESAVWLIGVVSGILGIGAYFSSNVQSARIEEALAKQNEKLDRIQKAMSNVSESGQAANASLNQISLELAEIKQSAEAAPNSSFVEKQSRFIALSSRAADLQLQIEYLNQTRLN